MKEAGLAGTIQIRQMPNYAAPPPPNDGAGAAVLVLSFLKSINWRPLFDFVVHFLFLHTLYYLL